MTKFIEVDNYRFEPEEASVFQSGVWERFVAATRENNNHVRRLLGEVLADPKLKLAYSMTLGERGLTHETMLIRVAGTQAVVFKAELKQAVRTTPLLEAHQLPGLDYGFGCVQSMWNDSALTRRNWRETKYRDFQGKTILDFERLTGLVEKAMTRLAPGTLGHVNERGNALCFRLRTKNVSDHEIVMTLYRH